MNNKFQLNLEKKINSFRHWSQDRQFQRCHLVQFNGVESVAGIDVVLHEVEMEIHGVLSEGLSVDWGEHENVLYLVVWEPPELKWTWTEVFTEQPVRSSA